MLSSGIQAAISGKPPYNRHELRSSATLRPIKMWMHSGWYEWPAVQGLYQQTIKCRDCTRAATYCSLPGTHKETDKNRKNFQRGHCGKEPIVPRGKKLPNEFCMNGSHSLKSAVGSALSGETRNPIKPADAQQERDECFFSTSSLR